MSLLPLGNTPADEPARQYQTRLNGGRRLPPANAELAATGLLKEFWGPHGGCPVQLEGILPNGEFVYFRARGERVELEISARYEDCEPHARYIKTLDTNHELGTGVLPEEICVQYIKRWLTDYQNRLQTPHSTYTGEAFVVNEAREFLQF